MHRFRAHQIFQVGLQRSVRLCDGDQCDEAVKPAAVADRLDAFNHRHARLNPTERLPGRPGKDKHGLPRPALGWQQTLHINIFPEPAGSRAVERSLKNICTTMFAQLRRRLSIAVVKTRDPRWRGNSRPQPNSICERPPK
jgi:hypothetical protein